jgi:uncharacterized Fe-S cluster protein YjdI
MEKKPKSYEGAKAIVTYDANLCIHAAECVKGLPLVFVPGRKPWVLPDEASPEDLQATISRCPSGALQFEPKD